MSAEQDTEVLRNKSGQILPGSPPLNPAGKKPGTVHQLHLLEALHSERMGGVEGLVTWGERNREAFYRLCAKLIPGEVMKEMADAGQLPPSITINVPAKLIDMAIDPKLRSEHAPTVQVIDVVATESQVTDIDPTTGLPAGTPAPRQYPAGDPAQAPGGLVRGG
jgi:hypothetical protein